MVRYYWQTEQECAYVLCNQVFRKINPTQVYCSKLCQDRAYRKRKREGFKITRAPRTVKCGDCGTVFVTVHPQQRYCQRRCSQRASDKRSYRLIRELEPERHARYLERKRLYSNDWRANNRLLGKCSRCGDELLEGDNLVCCECKDNTINGSGC